MTSNWSARLEYLYVSVDDIAKNDGRIPNVLGAGFVNKGIDFRDSVVRVGMNYRFGPRGGPVRIWPCLPRRPELNGQENI